jgi:hypothetical protein
MTLSDNPALFIFPIPAVNFWQRIQPLAPLEPGLYGDFWQGALAISGNNAVEVATLAQRSNLTVLALDTGGFSLADALALRKISPATIQQAIFSLPAESRPSQVYLPSWLDAQILGAGSDSSLGEIQILPLAESHPGSLRAENNELFSVLKVALRLVLVQSALWALPLLVFGWQSLSWGLASLLLAGVVSGLLWRLLSFSHFFRVGLISSLLAILMVSGLLLLADLSTLEIALRTLAVLLASLWLTLMMNGLKP